MIEFKANDFKVEDAKDNGNYTVIIKTPDTFNQLVKKNDLLPSASGIAVILGKHTNSRATISTVNKTIDLNYGKQIKQLATTDFSQACANAANQCVKNLVQSMETYATIIGTTIKPNKPK